MTIQDIVKILTDSGIEPNEANVEVKMLIEHFANFGVSNFHVDLVLCVLAFDHLLFGCAILVPPSCYLTFSI